MEFLCSFPRHNLAGKPMVVSPNVGCFLGLNKQAPGNNSQIEDQNLTFLNSTDSSNKTEHKSKCNADKWHFPMASVCAMVAHPMELLLIKWN